MKSLSWTWQVCPDHNIALHVHDILDTSGHSNQYACVQVLSLMGSVKWDIKEIRSQHSSYVDRLLQVSLGVEDHVVQVMFLSTIGFGHRHMHCRG